MNEDRLSRASDREIFEAVVSQLEDPELVSLRRFFFVLGAAVSLVGVGVVTVVAGLGWLGVLAFFSTFVPGVVLARRHVERGFVR